MKIYSRLIVLYLIIHKNIIIFSFLVTQDDSQSPEMTVPWPKMIETRGQAAQAPKMSTTTTTTTTSSSCHCWIITSIEMALDSLPPPPPPPLVSNQNKSTEKNNSSKPRRRPKFLFPPLDVVSPTLYPDFGPLTRIIRTYDLELDNSITNMPNKRNKEIEEMKRKCLIYQHVLEQNSEKFMELRRQSSQTQQQSPAQRQALLEDQAKMTKISEWNYQFCTMKVPGGSCTERMENLEMCWKKFHDGFKQYGGLNALLKSGAYSSELLCKKEKEAVERCAGKVVQRYVMFDR